MRSRARADKSKQHKSVHAKASRASPKHNRHVAASHSAWTENTAWFAACVNAARSGAFDYSVYAPHLAEI